MALATSLLPVSMFKSKEWRGGSCVSFSADYDYALMLSSSCRHWVVDGRSHCSAVPNNISISPGLLGNLLGFYRSPPRVLLNLERSLEAAKTPLLLFLVIVAANLFFFCYRRACIGLFERLVRIFVFYFLESALALTVFGATLNYAFAVSYGRS